MQIHAYDQPGALARPGHASALELEEQAPELDTLLVAVGGGGLIGGIAAWYARRSSESSASSLPSAPTLTRALEAGRPVDAPAGGIAADSLAPRRVGELMFPLAQKYVERVVLVEDQAIRDAQQALWERLRIVAEPGGAAAFAALLSRKYQPRCERARRGASLRGQYDGGGFRTIKGSTLLSGLAAQLAVQPLVEVHLGVFHRRLVGAGVVLALLVERAAAAVEALADLVVLDRGLDVRRLLRLDELALEEDDLLGVVELDHVGGARSASAG